MTIFLIGLCEGIAAMGLWVLIVLVVRNRKRGGPDA